MNLWPKLVSKFGPNFIAGLIYSYELVDLEIELKIEPHCELAIKPEVDLKINLPIKPPFEVTIKCQLDLDLALTFDPNIKGQNPTANSNSIAARVLTLNSS